MSKRKMALRSSQNSQNKRESCDDIFLSQDQPGPSSQSNRLLQRSNISKSSQEVHSSSQNMKQEEEMQLISRIIRYLLVADRGKIPIQKNHIIKNVLGGNSRKFRSIMEIVNQHLSEVFGYELLEIEGNKYILVNEIENNLPHLNFGENASNQVLLFLVLVHIFMLGDSCKEDVLWVYLRNLGIVTDNSYQHEYFGNVKRLVTVDFVNQRYLEKSLVDKNDPTKFEYKWGSRAENEISYRSVLKFVAKIYDKPLNNWKLQYKAVINQEKNAKDKNQEC